MKPVLSGTDVIGCHLCCTLTRLDIFDKLMHDCVPRVVRESGWKLAKLADHPDVDGFSVHDRLRQLILCDDSANSIAISAAERSEFLWHIFENLILGGNVNQFKNDIIAYRDVSRLLYKEVVRYGYCLSTFPQQRFAPLGFRKKAQVHSVVYRRYTAGSKEKVVNACVLNRWYLRLHLLTLEAFLCSPLGPETISVM